MYDSLTCFADDFAAPLAKWSRRLLPIFVEIRMGACLEFHHHQYTRAQLQYTKRALHQACSA